jgi:hypothetical protein
MVAGLDRNQILEIKNIDGNIIVNQNAFDTWVTSYRDILKIIFNTEYVPTITIKELEIKLGENENNPDKQAEIQKDIEQLIENETLVDDLSKYEKKLAEREKELELLILEYSKKISK